jgi:hypothetical protein
MTTTRTHLLMGSLHLQFQMGSEGGEADLECATVCADTGLPAEGLSSAPGAIVKYATSAGGST